MQRVVHFDIPYDQPERVVKFYETVFGWKIEKWGSQAYWFARTGTDERGIDGGLGPRVGNLMTTVNTIDVASLDAWLEKIAKNGGRVLTPKTQIPGTGWFAFCQDTEGNTFGIVEAEPMPPQGQTIKEGATPKEK